MTKRILLMLVVIGVLSVVLISCEDKGTTQDDAKEVLEDNASDADKAAADVKKEAEEAIKKAKATDLDKLKK